MSEKYMVVWIEEIEGESEEKKYIEHYTPFVDEPNNYQTATDFYNRMIAIDIIYSCNLCEIIISTDY